jgi:hypothetical protein
MTSQSHLSPEMSRADTAAMAAATLESTLSSGRLMHNTAATRFVEADGTRFAYRRFGNPIGTQFVDR